MKKVKNISLGDKVFAKVKGYPAWPARVDADLSNGRKFKVYFYGTGETGVVKPEDIFNYRTHKEQFMKHAKRKDYSEAMAQLEAAMAEDEMIEDDVEEISLPTEVNKDEEVLNRGLKRKLSIDSTSSESKKKSKSASSPKSNNKTDGDKTTEIGMSDEEPELSFQETSTKMNLTNAEDSTSEDDFMGEDIKKDVKPTKFTIITPQMLRDIIEEFDKSVKDAEKGNEKPDNDANADADNEILLARMSTDKMIGIKLNRNKPDKPFETEIDRLRWKEADARTALELKQKIEDGTLIPEDIPDQFEFDLELTESQQREAIQDRILERKKTKLTFLRAEASLVELDAAIKSNLALDKANPKEALAKLDIMLTLNIEPLMLKKHSHIMEMIRRLRRYIGNLKAWNLSEKELDEFKKDAEKIRIKAEVLYKKCLALFTVPDNKNFWDIFNEECDKFRNATKDMTENQMFILCSEPGSKLALWDEADEHAAMKIIAERNSDKKEKKVQEDKENSSRVINRNSENVNSDNVHTSTDSHG